MSDESQPRPRLRWRFPVIVLVLAVAALPIIHHRDWMESYIAAYLTAFLAIITFGLVWLWLIFFSGLPARTKAKAVGILILSAGAIALVLRLTTRVQGVVSGVGVPRLVWKWSPKPGQGLSPLHVDTTNPVDLADTTPRDFPEFLGPGRRNALTGIGLSVEWSASPPKPLWRQPIGLGWSSFAVVGRWAVTQEQRGGSELVVCYELVTGTAHWEHAHENTRFSEWQGGDGPRATPTIAGGRVYAMGATGFLDCLDGATGKEIWSRNILEDTHTRNQGYGKSCSPLIVDDLVIVTGGAGGPSLLAYRAQTGQPAWQSGSESPGYASPLLTTLAGVRQIITVNDHSVAGHGPTDGRLLWHYEWPGSMPKNVNPVPIDPDRVLISAGYGLGTTMLQLAPATEGLSVTELWTSRRLKPKFANVAVRGNFVYGLDDGILTCLDLSSGKRRWRGEEYGFGELLLVDDLLLVEAESGDIALVQAIPDTFRELCRFPALGEKCWANPALAGHHLLVRNDHEAACYEIP